MGRVLIAATIAVALTVIGVSRLVALEPPPSGVTTDPARVAYAAAQKQYQNEVYQLMASKWRRLEALLRIQRDLQIALIDQRTQEFYFLLSHRPEAIVRSKGVTAFSNFEISAAERRTLREHTREYAALEKRVTELLRQSNRHPLWPELREKFIAIKNDPQYLRAVERLNQAMREVETMLE